MFVAEYEKEIYGWQHEYEAQTRNMPSQLWGLVKSGKFVISADKRVVTNVKSGRKYTLDESGDLVEIVAVRVDRRGQTVKTKGHS